MVRDYLMIEYVVNELHYILLITESVAVPQILALVVLVHAFLKLRSHHNRRHSTRSCSAALLVYLLLGHLQLDVSLKRHVRHHYTDIFWTNQFVDIKIVPKSKQKIGLGMFFQMEAGNLHVERESHLGFQVADKQLCEVAHK